MKAGNNVKLVGYTSRAEELKKELQYWVSARKFVRQGRYQDAIDEYQKALSTNLSNIATRYEYAVLLTEQEQFQNARDELEKIALVIGQQPTPTPATTPTYTTDGGAILQPPDSPLDTQPNSPLSAQPKSPLAVQPNSNGITDGLDIPPTAFDSAFGSSDRKLNIRPISQPSMLNAIRQLFTENSDLRKAENIQDFPNLYVFGMFNVPTVNENGSTTIPPGCVNLIRNGSFETINADWVAQPSDLPPAYVEAKSSLTAVDGDQIVRLGIIDQWNTFGNSQIEQEVLLPTGATRIILTYRYYTEYHGLQDGADYQYATLYNITTGQLAASPFFQELRNDRSWLLGQFDLQQFSGQQLRLVFGVNNDGKNGAAGMYIDAVSLIACSLIDTSTPAPSPTSKLQLARNISYTLSVEEQALETLLFSESGQLHTTLRLNPILADEARRKAQDMADRVYFGHTDPDGFGPNYWARQAGYVFPDYYGTEASANNIESIAAGYSDSTSVWGGWMKSNGHHSHLLGEQTFYQEQIDYGIGYAYKDNGSFSHYWVILIAKPGN